MEFLTGFVHFDAQAISIVIVALCANHTIVPAEANILTLKCPLVSFTDLLFCSVGRRAGLPVPWKHTTITLMHTTVIWFPQIFKIKKHLTHSWCYPRPLAISISINAAVQSPPSTGLAMCHWVASVNTEAHIRQNVQGESLNIDKCW